MPHSIDREEHHKRYLGDHKDLPDVRGGTLIRLGRGAVAAIERLAATRNEVENFRGEGLFQDPYVPDTQDWHCE